MTISNETEIPTWGSPWDCPKCGHRNQNRSLCEHCRASKQWEASEPRAGLPTLAEQPPAQKRKKNWIRRTLVGILAFLVTAVGLRLVQDNRNQEAQARVTDYVLGVRGHEFVAADLKFRATFPGLPTRSEEHEEFGDTKVQVVIYEYDQGDVASFAVGTFPLTGDINVDLNAAVTGVAVGVKGRVETSQMTTFQTFPAAEATISVPDGVFLRALLVHTPTHLYELMVSGADREPSGYEEFKNSFKIEAN
jgi:hypothetical protein